MKTNLNKKPNNRKGVTLLELTVVILVLLSLISVLFIGARAWKRGSDRAACILNIRNFQQAVRSYANMNARNIGENLNTNGQNYQALIVGTGNFLEAMPTCPGGGSYSGQNGATVPAMGTVVLTCNYNAGGPAHTPENTGQW